jgi:hypothetical protein
MGFFKENKHANGTTSTDWGGSIGSGMGGMGGFAILCVAAVFYQYWQFVAAFIVMILAIWGLWKLYSPKQKEKRDEKEKVGEEKARNEIEQQYSIAANEFIADGNIYLISDIKSVTVKKPFLSKKPVIKVILFICVFPFSLLFLFGNKNYSIILHLKSGEKIDVLKSKYENLIFNIANELDQVIDKK